jgi:hypothetical protein
MLTMEDLMPRVDKGAAWLETKKPGWIDTVDLSRLALDDCARCILGQCFGDFCVVSEANTAGGFIAPWASEHGFALHAADYEQLDACGKPFDIGWNLLRECWVTVILSRRFAQEQSTASSTSAVLDAESVGAVR